MIAIKSSPGLLSFNSKSERRISKCRGGVFIFRKFKFVPVLQSGSNLDVQIIADNVDFFGGCGNAFGAPISLTAYDGPVTKRLRQLWEAIFTKKSTALYSTGWCGIDDINYEECIIPPEQQTLLDEMEPLSFF